MKNVNLIGTGRVGATMIRCLAQSKRYRLQDVTSRDLEKAEDLIKPTDARVEALESMRPADIWLLAVPDSTIASVAAQLCGVAPPEATLVHFSGFHTADIMASAGDCGMVSAHPNLSFADPELAAERFAGTLVGMEGQEAPVEEVSDMMDDLGARPFTIKSQDKILYHSAAVFSNNFNTVLQAVAEEMWCDAGVPKDVAHELTTSFLQATLDNVSHLGPARALTGPAARGDTAVVDAETNAVTTWEPTAGELYDKLSEMAVHLKTTGSVRSV